MRTARHTLLYDKDCPLCRAQMRRVRRLDWGRRFALLPLQDAAVASLAPALSREALAEAMHCVAADGRIFRGAAWLRFVVLRLPLVAPIGWLLWLPGALPLAERLYRRVSRNRQHLSRWWGNSASSRGDAG